MIDHLRVLQPHHKLKSRALEPSPSARVNSQSLKRTASLALSRFYELTHPSILPRLVSLLSLSLRQIAETSV